MMVTLETNHGPVTMDAVCIKRDVIRHGKISGGMMTTVTEIWREVNGTIWEYTESFIKPPMARWP